MTSSSFFFDTKDNKTSNGFQNCPRKATSLFLNLRYPDRFISHLREKEQFFKLTRNETFYANNLSRAAKQYSEIIYTIRDLIFLSCPRIKKPLWKRQRNSTTKTILMFISGSCWKPCKLSFFMNFCYEHKVLGSCKLHNTGQSSTLCKISFTKVWYLNWSCELIFILFLLLFDNAADQL